MDSITSQLGALVASLLARVQELEAQQEPFWSVKDYDSLVERNHELRDQVDDANEQCRELRRQIVNWESSYNTLRATYSDYAKRALMGDRKVMDEIRDLIQTKGMIPAIKHLRACSPFGLKEAKDFCDQLVIDEKLVKGPPQAA